MAAIIAMPARGDRNAPKFDPTKPRELRAYFSDVEFHLARAGFTTSDVKKEYSRRYLDLDTADLWETLPEYSGTATYDEYKIAILEIYPGSEIDRKWNVEDLKSLTEETVRAGIRTLGEFGEYHRHFLNISGFLSANGDLGNKERSRVFIQGFSPDLWERIVRRLEIAVPAHIQGDTYTLTEISRAARHVLFGTSTEVRPKTAQTTAIVLAPLITAPAYPVDDPNVKTEPASFPIDAWAQALAKALMPTGSAPPRYPPQSAPRREGTNACNFCSATGHYIRECGVVQEYVDAGKIRRDAEGKVILSSGAFVPRSIPGQWLRDRVDEWHRQNPGQLARAQLSASTMMFDIIPQPARASYVALPAEVGEREAFFERELFNLRRAKTPFQPIIKTRHQRAQENEATSSSAPSTATDSRAQVAQPPRRTPTPGPVPQHVNSAPRSLPQPPIHPFAEARDATLRTPVAPATVAPATPTNPANIAPRRADNAYRNAPPVYDKRHAVEVFNSAMEAPITITHRQLYSIAPEVRAQTREVLSGKRIATDTGKAREVQFLEADEVIMEGVSPADEDLFGSVSNQRTEQFTQDMPSSFVTAATAPAARAAEPLIIPDPYEAYLRKFPAGHPPDTLIVAKESSALCSILPMIDNHLRIESIMDPGCQITAMSEEVCHALGLHQEKLPLLEALECSSC